MTTFNFGAGRVRFHEADPNWEPQWLIEGLIEKHKLNFICGTAKKANKSSFRRFLLAALLTEMGQVLGEFAVKERPKQIFHLLCEDEPGKERRLLTASLQALGFTFDPEDLGKFVSWNDVVADDGFQINNQTHLSQLEQFVRDEKIDLLVIDPLRDFHNIDENESTRMIEVTKPLRRLARYAECTMQIVQHTAKPPWHKTDTKRSAGDSMRGSNVLGAAAAVTVLIERTGQELRRVIRDCKNYEDETVVDAILNMESWLWSPAAENVVDLAFQYVVNHAPIENRTKAAEAIGRRKEDVLHAFSQLLEEGRIHDSPEGLRPVFELLQISSGTGS